jgi:hypothetical protein
VNRAGRPSISPHPYFFQISFRVFVALSFLDFFSFFLPAMRFLLYLDCPHGRCTLEMKRAALRCRQPRSSIRANLASKPFPLIPRDKEKGRRSWDDGPFGGYCNCNPPAKQRAWPEELGLLDRKPIAERLERGQRCLLLELLGALKFLVLLYRLRCRCHDR